MLSMPRMAGNAAVATWVSGVGRPDARVRRDVDAAVPARAEVADVEGGPPRAVSVRHETVVMSATFSAAPGPRTGRPWGASAWAACPEIDRTFRGGGTDHSRTGAVGDSGKDRSMPYTDYEESSTLYDSLLHTSYAAGGLVLISPRAVFHRPGGGLRGERSGLGTIQGCGG